MIVAGVMSGTSLDGVSVAAVALRGAKWELLEFLEVPYPERLRARILAVSNAEAHTGEVARLGFELGERYAAAVLKLGVKPELIGCHGQTVYHAGDCTLQLGEAQVIAERTGVPVVNNFRPRDMAAGGQGAPLVPFVDYLLFRHLKKNRVLLNIGGIANITAIPAHAGPDDVIAFDTGPGNMVIDQLAYLKTRGMQTFDKNGRMARRGRADRELLRELLGDAYYADAPPKSCGREQYGKEFVERLLGAGLAMDDLLTTATVLTPLTIAEGIRRHAGFVADELIAAGGGTKNPVIMEHLRGLLPETRVMTTDEFGLPAAAKEAVAFAILAYQTWRKRTGNLPSATGARRRVILGQVTFA
jgi:anhydro-N-acetylmuramic acid kinase